MSEADLSSSIMGGADAGAATGGEGTTDTGGNNGTGPETGQQAVTEGQKTEPQGGEVKGKPWMAQLADNLKNNETLAGYENLTKLAEGFLDLKGKVEGAVIVPGENATDAEKAAYREALKIPEAADGYELKVNHEGLKYSDSDMGYWKSVAHKLNLTPAQAQGMLDGVNNMLAESTQKHAADMKNAREAATDALKKEWASEYDKRRGIAKHAVLKFAGMEGLEALHKDGFTDNPRVIKLFHEIGKAILDDQTLSGEPGGGGGEGTNNNGDKRPRDPVTGKPMLTYKT